MPPPSVPPLPQRRATRPRALGRRVYSRSVAALEMGLDAIAASGQAAIVARSTAAGRRPVLVSEPQSGAGDESFLASPLTLSPAQSTESVSSITRSLTPSRQQAPASAATLTPGTLKRAAQAPLPRTPRFPAPLPGIPVGRFPSPPHRVGEKTLTASPPPPLNMPTMSSGSPMEIGTTGPTYASMAASQKSPALSPSTCSAAVAPAATNANINTTATVTAASASPSAAAGTASAAPPTKQPNRYPPLIVETLPDWPTHFRELKKVLGHTPNGRPFGKGVRFIPKTDQEFRLIQRYLTQLESNTGISWFCYSLPAERSVKVAIRGLPANTEPALVETELRELGFTPEHVRAIPARPGRPGCLMFAQLQRTPDLIPGIYEVSELLCMPGITIEAWRGRKGPAQCHRCQQFRHSSQNCHRPIACVRCGENHSAKECQRPREEPPTCANCGGAHTANNATCPIFRKETRNRRAGTVARTATSARVPATEADAPGSLMAAANQPGPTTKRRRKRGKRTQTRPPAAQPTAPLLAAPATAPPTTAPPTALPAASTSRPRSAPPVAPQPTQRSKKSKPSVVAAPIQGTKAKRAGGYPRTA
ncbi:uncharacterized protein LOC123698750 [Colias croceus]|uniref:uncharacterized protein LOC123698750 n=1 Tax=Colias crocea TaxID=72248 RepID=UPI001E27FE84|nr:uncharacterized protein LOC123698750 [Colias croceus]